MTSKLLLALVFSVIVCTSAACQSKAEPTPTSIPTQPPASSTSTTTSPAPITTSSPTQQPATSLPPATSRPAAPSYPPFPAATSTATHNTIDFGSRTLTNNIWGASPDESLTSGVYLNTDGSFGWYWSRENPIVNPGYTLALPIYPNVRIGGDLAVKSNSEYFPVKAADITSLKFDVDYKYPALPTEVYNLAYEMFFSDTNQPGSNLIPKAEVMIWIHATFTQPPSSYIGDFTDGFNTYHLFAWIRADGRLYASFIMDGQPQFQAQHTVDVKRLLANLTIDPNWYLLGVDLGSEIVSGTGKIEISQFNINLNGAEP